MFAKSDSRQHRQTSLALDLHSLSARGCDQKTSRHGRQNRQDHEHREELERCGDQKARLNRLCELNVIRQVRNVASDVFLQEAWARGQEICVHGWVYSLSNGLVNDLNVTVCGPYDLIAPPSIKEVGCLMVMGSEGRGEQTVRTDQDNGLILSAPVPEADLDRFRTEFSGALAQFGFPPCPGNVMVRNPFWSRPLGEFVADFRSWVALPTPDAFP